MNGKQSTIFYDEAYRIFTVRCVNYSVTEVRGLRAHSVMSNAPDHGSQLTSEPSVAGFVHSEDFYEWYMDYFVNYYEAEAYYYAHGGKG